MTKAEQKSLFVTGREGTVFTVFADTHQEKRSAGWEERKRQLCSSSSLLNKAQTVSVIVDAACLF